MYTLYTPFQCTSTYAFAQAQLKHTCIYTLHIIMGIQTYTHVHSHTSVHAQLTIQVYMFIHMHADICTCMKAFPHTLLIPFTSCLPPTRFYLLLFSRFLSPHQHSQYWDHHDIVQNCYEYDNSGDKTRIYLFIHKVNEPSHADSVKLS